MTDDERIDAIKAAKPVYVSDLARRLAHEIFEDIEDEHPHYARDYEMARWLDAMLKHPATPAEQDKEKSR
jgi:hypothetical protein